MNPRSRFSFLAQRFFGFVVRGFVEPEVLRIGAVLRL
jgi:hypothetical protein